MRGLRRSHLCPDSDCFWWVFRPGVSSGSCDSSCLCSDLNAAPVEVCSSRFGLFVAMRYSLRSGHCLMSYLLLFLLFFNLKFL
jgi:hypothetical protein